MKLSRLADVPIGHLEVTDAEPIDGDTLKANIYLGFNVSIQARIRLKGFYAPEHFGQTPEAALAATKALGRCLQAGGLSLPAKGLRPDKYGRCVGVLHQWGRPLNPHEVLGVYQLTEGEHLTDLNFARKLAGSGSAAL